MGGKGGGSAIHQALCLKLWARGGRKWRKTVLEVQALTNHSERKANALITMAKGLDVIAIFGK